jgi:RimJ/RimL family protein N-acetyltransferase
VLSGERVLLRPIEPADLPRLWELVTDHEVSVLSSQGPVGPFSRAEFQARYETRDEESKRHAFYFAVVVDGELVGQCGLHAIDHFNRSCEVGIEIGRDYWRKGYGQDAVRTLVDYAFAHLNMNRVGLYVLADDPRAVGAYRKAGFLEEGRLRQTSWVHGGYHDAFVMSVLREGWKPGG